MTPHRGEIWQIRFDPSVGAEIQKVRPAVVMSVSSLGLLPVHIVVPITHWRPEFDPLPWIVRLLPTAENGLSKESGADAYQVKSVSERRFVQRLGELSPAELREIAAAIALCVGYAP